MWQHEGHQLTGRISSARTLALGSPDEYLWERVRLAAENIPSPARVHCAGCRQCRKALPGGALSCGILSYWLVHMDLRRGNESVGDLVSRSCAFTGN